MKKYVWLGWMLLMFVGMVIACTSAVGLNTTTKGSQCIEYIIPWGFFTLSGLVMYFFSAVQFIKELCDR